MDSPKEKSRQPMKDLDIRHFFQKSDNKIRQRQVYEDEVVESSPKRSKYDVENNSIKPHLSQIESHSNPNMESSLFQKCPTDAKKLEANTSTSTACLQQRPEDINEGLQNSGDMNFFDTNLKLEVQNREFFKFMEFSKTNRTLISIQRLESTQHFSSKVKKKLIKYKQKASCYYKEEYEVEKILDYRWDKKAKEGKYQIKWSGYEELTWEPIENVISCQVALEEFYLSRTMQRDSARPSVKHKIEVPPDPRERYEQRWEFLDKLCPPPDQTRLQEFFDRYKVEKMKSWDDVKFYSIVDKYKEKNVPPDVAENLREQMMIKHLLAKRKDQLDRLKEWETEINKKSSEPAPLRIENEVDFEGPPRHMTYIGENIIGDGVVFNDDPPMWCECDTGECQLKNEKSCCPGNHNQHFPYTKLRKLRVPLGTPIFECNKKCKCGPTCPNRVVQKGRRFKLCIYRTSNGCGWGVKTLEPIKKGAFVVEYVGEVIMSEEAERRGKTYDANGITYLFDVDFHESENLYTIDAALYGNVAHFINHSCNPNLAIYSVWVNNLDPNLPKLCFYAIRDIEKGEQLSFDYSQKIDNGETQSESDGKGLTNCKCAAPNCRKVLFLI